MSASGSSVGSLRMLRSRVVLLSLPGLIALLYLTSAYYNRDVSSERVGWLPSSLSSSSKQTTSSKAVSSNVDWQEQADQRKACWAHWFSDGTVCETPPQRWSQQDKLDLIWTWSNTTLASAPSATESNTSASQAGEASDLLRYSFRSAQQHMHSGFGSITLLTPDVPTPAQQPSQQSRGDQCTHTYQDDQRMTHTGQRPCWLATVDPVFEPPSLLHHRQVACADKHHPGKDACSQPMITEAAKPATATLLAAQATHLSDTRLVVAPHHIFASDVSASDFWSPLYGPIFRLDATSEDSGSIPATNSTNPSDAPLIRANSLLNQRFGPRPRRRLLDLPQPLSSSILAELQQTWPQELSLATSALSDKAVDLPTLHAHYMIQRHREALLWSFLVAKHDRDGDGAYSSQEATALLKDLDADLEKQVTFPPVYVPARSSNDKALMAHNLQRAGLPKGLGRQDTQVSLDGNALYAPRMSLKPTAAAPTQQQDQGPVVCSLDVSCVGSLIPVASSNQSQSLKASVTDLFTSIAYQMPDCGNCMILQLLAKSGDKGLSAFLPAADLVMPPIKTLPLVKTFQEVGFAIQPSNDSHQVSRLDVVSEMLSRYVHSVIVEAAMVAPNMTNRLSTTWDLTALEFFDTSSLFSFKQHGVPSDPSQTTPKDAWIWTKCVRAWLSLRYPFPMRFESHTTEL